MLKGTINLDIGCSDKKKEGYQGMDNRDLPGVDYVHDLENIPWPIEDEQCYTINASHVMEHMKPWKFFEIMDECWRVVQVGGGIDIRVPIGLPYKMDPTHMIEFNHLMFWYLDPEKESYQVYKPKPWKIAHTETTPTEIRVILQKDMR